MPFIKVKRQRVTITYNQFQLPTEDHALMYWQEEDWGSQASCGALFGDESLRHCMPRGWQDRPARPQAASHIEDSIVGPLPKILELATSSEKRVVA